MKLYENKDKCTVKIATSLEELAMIGVISFSNRPNPRKRRGRRNMINEASTRSSMPSLNRNNDYHRRPSNIDEHEKINKMDLSNKRKVMRGMQSINTGCIIRSNVKDSLEETDVKQVSADPSKSHACEIRRTEKNLRGNAKQRCAKSKYRDDNGVRKRKRF